MTNIDAITTEYNEKKNIWRVSEDGDFKGWLKEEGSLWHYCYEKNPEFWSIESYPSNKESVVALVEKVSALDEFRLKTLGIK